MSWPKNSPHASIARRMTALLLVVALIPGWGFAQAPTQPGPPPAEEMQSAPAEQQQPDGQTSGASSAAGKSESEAGFQG
jgi:hypothetical protein